MDSFFEASTAEKITRSLSVVSRASDKVRGPLLESLLKEEPSTKAAFFSIHRAHFEEDPLVAQFHHDALLERPYDTFEYVQTVAKRVQGDYSSVIGCLRSNNPRVGDIEFPDAEALPDLADRFFTVLDKYEKFDSEEDFWNFLLAADVFLRSTHLPYDGSGRTNEDFLSFLCKKFNYNFTLSKSGLRGMLTGGLVSQSDNLKDLLKLDVDGAGGSYLVTAYRVLTALEARDFSNLKNFNNYYLNALSLYRGIAQESTYLMMDERLRVSISERIANLVGEPMIIRIDRLKEFSEELGLE